MASIVRVPKRWAEALKLYRAMMRQSGEARAQSQIRLDRLVQRLGELSREEWGVLFARCPRKIKRAFMVYVMDIWADGVVGKQSANG